VSQARQLSFRDASSDAPAAELEIADRFSPEATAVLFHGDRLQLLRQIRDAGAQAQLIITSPPYNLGKEYEEALSLDDYLHAQRETITECVKILSPTGSICWQVGNYIESLGSQKEVYPLDIMLYDIFKGLGLRLRNRIVWHFGHGLHASRRFSGRHETILWFTFDTSDYLFNLDAVRVPQKYPGKKAYKGPHTGKPSGNPLGKNPSDVWHMPNVKSNHIEKTIHPCQFPIALVERLILALTNDGDLVVDPYIGVGTTAAASVMHNRRAAGADIVESYLTIARNRVMQAWDGTLPVRPLNKPVYEPSERLALTQRPMEWDR
jgi:adenine-specific DNA-methyltransferase